MNIIYIFLNTQITVLKIYTIYIKQSLKSHNVTDNAVQNQLKIYININY